MQIKVENLHKEIRRLRSEVNEIRSLVRGVFVDEEGVIREDALKELAKARITPKREYIHHEEVEKWFGRLSGTRKRLRR